MLAAVHSGNRFRSGDELEKRAHQAAAAMRAMGLRPGDVVGILMRNDIAFIELLLGAERAGITAVPLNWHSSQEELRHVLEDSSAAALFVHADFLDKIYGIFAYPERIVAVDVPPEVAQAYRVTETDCQVPTWVPNYEIWLCAAASDVSDPQPPQFRLLYTSGSTGKPKGVLRWRGAAGTTEHFAYLARLAHGLEVHPIRAVMTGPLYHSAPNSYALNCVRFGELLVLQPKFDAGDLLRLIVENRISHLHAVPTMFGRLLALPPTLRGGADVSSLRAVAHGSAMCPVEIKQSMIDWWGPVLYEYYAATEVGIVTAIDSHEWLERRGSVGRPPTGVEIRIVGEDGSIRAAGEQGEIQVRSAAVPLVEYKGLQEATHEMRQGDWATLGDVGYVDAAGYLWLTDRKKDLLISGGVNIFPAEIEQCLMRHPQVRDAIAFGVRDDELGEVVCALVELHAPASESEDALRAYVRDTLGSLRAPRHIQFLDRLPREDTGKLARRKARDAFLQMVAEGASHD